MLRWSGGVTLHDKIRNELIREIIGMKDPASSKVVERRPNWYGHINRQRRPPDDLTTILRRNVNVVGNTDYGRRTFKVSRNIETVGDDGRKGLNC